MRPDPEAKQVPPPTFVEVLRREGSAGATLYAGDNIHVRPELSFDPQGAPDPIRQSQYYPVGKPSGFRWAHMPIALYLNIRNANGGIAESFLTGKVRPSFLHFMRNGLGGQNPVGLGERPNIDRPISAPYGDRRDLPGDSLNRGTVTANGLTYQGPHESQWW